MRSVVVLFTRDLRVHDHPALTDALRVAERVVPLFVLDDAIVTGRFGVPNRLAFLHDSLTDLRRSLRALGGDLVVRRGDPVERTIEIARQVSADAVFTSADVSALARGREEGLAEACAGERVAFARYPGVTVVPPDEVVTSGGGDYKVFTPYWRAWRDHPWRDPDPPPTGVRLPPGIDPGVLPERDDLAGGSRSPGLAPGGETAARARLDAWTDRHLADYETLHDDLGADGTSRLSPYLHFGNLSPLEVAVRLGERPGGAAFVRQLAWRDFHHQVTFHHPSIARRDLRRARRWRLDDALVAAWRQGRTGYPIVDAGMRQLVAEGWMHNRTRMIVASVLTKHWGVDWRVGAAHFERWLVDGDVANNSANWQWVAGTGADTRPNRIFNPISQARRLDPDGAYVRRWVPELGDLDRRAVHEPWRLDPDERAALGYPAPVFDHEETAAAFRARA